jgi:hypothetical protein
MSAPLAHGHRNLIRLDTCGAVDFRTGSSVRVLMKMKKVMAVGAGGEPRPARFSKLPVVAQFASMGSDGVHGPLLAGDGEANRRADDGRGLVPFQEGRISPERP